jgi:hypothetical protein
LIKPDIVLDQFSANTGYICELFLSGGKVVFVHSFFLKFCKLLFVHFHYGVGSLVQLFHTPISIARLVIAKVVFILLSNAFYLFLIILLIKLLELVHSIVFLYFVLRDMIVLYIVVSCMDNSFFICFVIFIMRAIKGARLRLSLIWYRIFIQKLGFRICGC